MLPDPDVLPLRVAADEARPRRARLKVFFGFAPGVGKTFRMLEVARGLREQGVDVVIGVIETHGRKETAALLRGVEVVPRRQVASRGHEHLELDVDAIVTRRPAVVLIDELAHTNVPGSRHAKRWLDVLEVLDAGIDVLSTLNVQHVESLNDVVAQITHVQVRETVPDSLLDRADAVELIDLAPEELLARLREGKVGEQASGAAPHFFQRGNLLALRELALRRTAERVDADVTAYRSEHGVEGTWAASERIMVCVGPSPASARLVRAARRMAAGLRASWVAAYVDAPGHAPLLARDRERLEGHLRLAESLGGSLVRLSAVRASDAVLLHARKHNVTRIILGKPTHSRLRDLLRGSMLDEIVRGSGDIDVHVISGDEEVEPTGPSPAVVPRRWHAGLRAYLGALGLVAATSLLALAGDRVLGVPDVEMLYLLVIMVVAVLLGRGPSLLAAGAAVLAFDFFFVHPRLTFQVADASYILTFVMMFLVGITLGTLAGRLRSQERQALDREARTAALLALSRDLSSAADEPEVAIATARHAADVFLASAAIFIVDDTGAPQLLAAAGGDDATAGDDGLPRWVTRHGAMAGLGTDTMPVSTRVCAPIRLGGDTLGAIAIAPAGGVALTRGQRDFLEAIARQAALALARARLAGEARRAALRVKAEELRSSLLSLVSHDLRTPLAVITGAATALRDEPALPPATSDDLVETICEEAERLEQLVTNLLDMTRLESGVALRKEWMPPVEVIGAALTRLERRLTGRAVHIDLPDGLPLVELDPVLAERLVGNLIDNALKHSPPGTPLEIVGRIEEGRVVLELADRGPGITLGDEERVFERFYRAAGTRADGVGLGLPICRAIAQAHGAELTAHQREGSGAMFRLRLASGGPPPSSSPIAEPPSSGRSDS